MTFRGLVLILAGLAVSCSSMPKTTATAPSATVTSVAITGVPSLTAVGQTGQLTATATFSDGTTQNVTASATWQSSNTSVATVSPAGVVTAVASGTATITVTYQGKSTTANATITLSTAGGNVLTATIDGAAFTGISVTVAHTTGILSVGGVNAFTGQYISLSFAFPQAVGSYGLAPLSVANAQLQIPNAASSWVAGPLGGSGTIVVTALTDNSVTGTFTLNLVALPNTNATGTKVVTNGVFNVTF